MPPDLIDELDRSEDESFTDSDGKEVSDDEPSPAELASRSDPAGSGGTPAGDAARAQEAARQAAIDAANAARAAKAKGPAPDGDADDEKRSVPLAALLAERKRTDAAVAQLKQELAEAKAAAEKAAELAKPKPAEDVEPDKAKDMAAWVDWRLKQQDKAHQAELAKLKGEVETTTKSAESTAAQAELTGLITDLSAKEAAFEREHTDYKAALAHVRVARATQIALAYPNASDEQIEQAIRSEEIQTAAALRKQGINPIEYVYSFAKTIGFKTAGTEDAGGKKDDPNLGAKPNGKGAPVKDPKTGKFVKAEDLASDPAATLGTGGGQDEEEADDDDSDVLNEAIGERFGARFQRKAS